MGFPGSDAAGEEFYEQAEIQIISALKGNLTGSLKVAYSVHSMPGKHQESSPLVGAKYIMFIHKLGPNEYEIKKLLEATNANISSLKSLIASQSTL